MLILIWLMLLLVGCTSDNETAQDDRRGSESPADNAANTDPLEDISAPPFVVGTSHRLVLEISELTPGEKDSSIELTVSFAQRETGDEDESETGGEGESETDGEGESETGGEGESETDGEGESETDGEDGNEGEDVSYDPDAIFVGETEVNLFWVCGEEEHRGHSEVKMRGNDRYVKTTVLGLPPLPKVGASIHCVITAKLEAKDRDGEKVLASGSSGFHIEADVLYPALQMQVVDRETDQDGRSGVDLKVAIIRNGEIVKQGDVAFAEKVNVDLEWKCSNATNDESAKKTRIRIGAGRGEETGSVSLPARPELGEPRFVCMITATSRVSGYNIPIVEQKRVWVAGRDLQVAITQAVSGSPLGYTVTADNKELSEKVTLTISSATGQNGCGVLLKKENEEAISTIAGLSSTSDDTVSLAGSGIDCVLTATVKSGGNPEREGSKTFTVPAEQN